MNDVPYACHNKPRLVFFPAFFTAVYIVERLVLQTIYILNKEILQFLGLKFAVYNRERFQINGARKLCILYFYTLQGQRRNF